MSTPKKALEERAREFFFFDSSVVGRGALREKSFDAIVACAYRKAGYFHRARQAFTARFFHGGPSLHRPVNVHGTALDRLAEAVG
jgi:hypothetical protein